MIGGAGPSLSGYSQVTTEVVSVPNMVTLVMPNMAVPVTAHVEKLENSVR